MQRRLAEETSVNAELLERLEQRSSELETARKKANRDIPIRDGIDTKPSTNSPNRHDSNTVREEMAGLKCVLILFERSHDAQAYSRHIIQELQKENVAASQQNKLLESENRLLTSETEKLRQVRFYITAVFHSMRFDIARK